MVDPTTIMAYLRLRWLEGGAIPLLPVYPEIIDVKTVLQLLFLGNPNAVGVSRRLLQGKDWEINRDGDMPSVLSKGDRCKYSISGCYGRAAPRDVPQVWRGQNLD